MNGLAGYLYPFLIKLHFRVELPESEIDRRELDLAKTMNLICRARLASVHEPRPPYKLTREGRVLVDMLLDRVNQKKTAKADEGKSNAKPEPQAKAVPNAAAVLPDAIRNVIEDTSRSVDDRLRDISRTLPEFFARKSPSLAETFGCTPDNIRQTQWWKVDRKAWLERQKREGSSFDDL